MSELVADVRGAGPAVVLLHGQPGSRGDWALVAARLEADFLVITPDRPGYGATGGRARGFRGNAAAVVSLLDRLGVAKATVAGHSWGGGVALALAESAPRRLNGLVLASSISPNEPLGRLDRILAQPPVGAAVTAIGFSLASGALSLGVVRRALERRQRDTGEGAQAMDALTAAWGNRRVWESFVTEQRSLIDELPSLGAVLAAISVPTVVMVGADDRVVAPDAGRDLASAIPGARLVELPGAGHLLAYQRPDAVAAAVREVAAS